MNAIIGRKLGMTRIYTDEGVVVPVTVVEAGPCPVVAVRNGAGGGQSVQLGFGARKPTRTTKAVGGHARAAGLEQAPAVLQDFPLPAGADVPQAGQVVTVEAFAEGEKVKVTGTTKGRGFQGVVKRYGFRGGSSTHGNTRYRRPGSMGPGTDPSRVIKGKKLPGQYGNVRHTETGIQVVRVDADRNLLFLKGAIPGPVKGVVTVRKQGGKSRYA